jgi:hypothetical protein
MLRVFRLGLEVDKNIVNENQDEDIQFLHEDVIHEIHEIRQSVG